MTTPNDRGSRLKDLAARIARTNLANAEADAVVVANVLGERDRLRKVDEALARCLHAAAALVRSIPGLESDVATEVQRTAIRLVRLVAEASEQLPARQDASAEPEDEPRTLNNLNDLSIGQFLVQLGFVTQADVEEALERMNGDESLRLGDVLCDMGRVKRKNIEAAERLRATLSHQRSDPEPAAAPSVPHLLGEIMIEKRMIERVQLEQALKAQKKTGKWIGATLVELGAASWTDVTEAMREQSSRRAASSAPQPR